MIGFRIREWYRLNFISRMLMLLLVPTLFRWLNFAFIWHSIFWGAITMVVLIWGGLILISPLVGRIGCGWICFFGTMQDLASGHAFFRAKHRKSMRWLQALIFIAFIASAGTFHYLNVKHGFIQGWHFAPFALDNVFNEHYKHIWIYDTFGVFAIGLLFHKRWMCKNLCAFGFACAAAARHSRLVLTLDPSTCNSCSRCERECPVAIPILDVVKKNRGLIADPECLLCGKCRDVCNRNSINFEFIWNRAKRLCALHNP